MNDIRFSQLESLSIRKHYEPKNNDTHPDKLESSDTQKLLDSYILPTNSETNKAEIYQENSQIEKIIESQENTDCIKQNSRNAQNNQEMQNALANKEKQKEIKQNPFLNISNAEAKQNTDAYANPRSKINAKLIEALPPVMDLLKNSDIAQDNSTILSKVNLTQTNTYGKEASKITSMLNTMLAQIKKNQYYQLIAQAATQENTYRLKFMKIMNNK